MTMVVCHQRDANLDTCGLLMQDSTVLVASFSALMLLQKSHICP
jgi:hypothetical protein